MTSPALWIRCKVLRCPTCGKAPLAVEETFTSTWSWDYRRGERMDEGYSGEGHDILRVEAICSCGRRWRLRGVRQVTDLDTEDSDAPRSPRP